jgi:GTP cyclohydrolase I
MGNAWFAFRISDLIDMAEEAKKIDMERLRRAAEEILLAVGEDIHREGLQNTPERVARMYAELLGGTLEDPRIHLQSVFTEKYDEIVLLRDIPFYSVCEHHLLPFIGKAHVAYLPTGKVLGISKIARIVDSFAHRLQAQERLTGQIADFLMQNLRPLGVAVVLQASHSCMTLRGIRKPGSVMVTSALRGTFKKDARSRAEVLQLMHHDKA